MLSQTRLLQWAFVNAKFDHSFERQSEDVQTQLLAAWSYVTEEQRRVFEREALLEGKQREHELLRTLQARNREVTELSKHFGEFQQSYTTFAQAVGETANKMPVKNVVVGDPEELAALLAECGELLRIIEEPKSQPSGYSRTVDSLSVSVEEVSRELAECSELMKQIEEAERLERSLKIDQIQCR